MKKYKTKRRQKRIIKANCQKNANSNEKNDSNTKPLFLLLVLFVLIYFNIRQVQNLEKPHKYRYSRIKKTYKYKYFKIEEVYEYRYFKMEKSHGYKYLIVEKFDRVI